MASVSVIVTRRAAADLLHLEQQPGAGVAVRESLRYAAAILDYLAEYGQVSLGGYAFLAWAQTKEKRPEG